MDRLRLIRAGLVILVASAASCAGTLPHGEMRVMVDGVNCDPEHATLVAQSTNESSINSVHDRRCCELFRTQGGHHYFVENAEGSNLSVELISRTEAMKIYDSLPDHRLDFTQAFAD